MDIVRAFPIYLFETLIVTAIVGVEGDLNNIIFQKEVVVSATKIRAADAAEPFNFFKNGKLCNIAKTKLSLPFIDEDYEPEVFIYVYEYDDGERRSVMAMNCATLPSIYLRPNKKSYDEVIVTSVVQPVVAKMKILFDKTKPSSIQLVTRQPLSSLKENHLSQLNHGSRQYLCMLARKKGIFLFTNNYVPPLHSYTFMYYNTTQIHYAIPCPTYPMTYLRLGTWTSETVSTDACIIDDESEIILTFAKPVHQIESVKGVRPARRNNSSTDSEGNELAHESLSAEREEIHLKSNSEALNRELLTSLNEKDRHKICENAKNAIAYTVKLSPIIDEPNLYEFYYGNGSVREYFALRCSAGDEVFVYLESSSNERALKKIVLLESKLLEYD